MLTLLAFSIFLVGSWITPAGGQQEQIFIRRQHGHPSEIIKAPNEAETPSQEVALLLHRKGFDCNSTPVPSLPCTWSSQDEVNLDDLFSPLQFRSVRRSGLTLLREDDEPESAQQQQPPHISYLRPMEISAFRVEID